MRSALLLVVVAAGLVPAAPAAASCNAALYAATGRCENQCTLAAGAYHAAREASGNALPYVQFLCPA